MENENEYELSFTAEEVDERLRKAGEAVLSTEQTITPEQQAQATKNIGAVPVNKTFDVAKTVTTGKNLLNLNAPMPDPDNLYSGGFLRDYRFEDDGTIVQYSSGAITDYIAVIPGKAMALSTNATGTRAAMAARRVMGYDAEKRLIGLLASSQNGITTSVLANAAYVRLQFDRKDVDAEGQVEYADVWNGRTEYEPYTEFVIDGAYTLKKECLPETLGGAVLYTPQSLTPEQKAHARANIGAADAQYIQNPNLYDGSWRVGRYDENTGADVTEGNDYCCSVNPIKLDPSKSYNIQVKDGFNKYRALVVYKYNADGSYIERIYISYTNQCFVGGITGVDYIQVAVERYATDFPNEPLHLMVWETDNPDERYKEWLEYGETSNYYQSKLLLTSEQMPDNVKLLEQTLDNMRADNEYIQNPNLYDGEWELGAYDGSTGKKYDSTHTCRNVNRIYLDATKSYNVQIKKEFNALTMRVFKYDVNGTFLGLVSTSSTVKVIHLTGVASIDFHVVYYATTYPNEPLHVMVWESEDDDQYEEFLEYRESGSYYNNKLLIKESQVKNVFLPLNKALFDDSFNSIAYSSVAGSTGYINTAEHFKWSAKQGFTAIKGDVQPTSDGKLVMCHDDGFTLNSDGQLTTYDAANSTPIHDMTEEQCLALQHRNGNHVCPFETYIRICKQYGKIAYITIRNAYMDVVVPEMFKILDKYSMRKRCIVNSFNVASLQAVRAMDNGITLSNVLNYETVLTKAHIDTATSLGNCQICSFFFTASTVSEDTNGDGVMDGFDLLEQSKEALSYAQEKDIRVYSAIHYEDVDIDKLLQYGIMGAQLAIVPNFD